MVEEMLLLGLLVLVRLAPTMTAWASSSKETTQTNLPIDFDVRPLDSNDHAIALVAQKIANKATGDAVDTDHNLSKCIELIFATGPIRTLVGPISLLRGPKILCKLYANDPISGILEYQYTILGAGLA